MIYKDLGAKIRRERLKLNLTQEKLAEDIGISTAFIGQIERGEKGLTLEKLIAVVNRLGVTIDYLLADAVPIEDKTVYSAWSQLMEGKSEKEKLLAVNLVKLVFGYLEKEADSKTVSQAHKSKTAEE